MAAEDQARKRLLVIEDQAEIRKLIRMTLEFEPYQVHEASDGVAGLRLAVDLQPDLILLDVMMPGELDGLQVCQRVRGDPRLAVTRVLMLTARSRVQDLAAGQQAGADAYLTKPFSPLQLVETIERLLGPC
jgi:DNA-binding response OmpR family regulator